MLFGGLCSFSAMGEEKGEEKVKPDTWTAVDGLGRTVSDYSETGGKRKGKYVGMFYWTWHTNERAEASIRNNINISELLCRYPEAEIRNNVNHEAWENTRYGTSYFWDEPIFGYYRNNDAYVIRKHAELLADAGVDVIIFDCTNGTNTFKSAYEMLFEVFAQARREGVNTPQVAFMLNFASLGEAQAKNTVTELKQLYANVYKKERYKDLWFLWDGKPLVMASKDVLSLSNPTEAELSDFFTFRDNEPSYFAQDTTIEQEKWGWCSVYPQTKYGVRSDGSVEQMTVSVAQNATENHIAAMNHIGGGVLGRGYAKGDYSYSYTYQNKTITINKETENAYYYGLNFQQQWDYALAVDPDFLFITGWNEWLVDRFEEWMGTPNAFPDNYNDEFSRDIEPSRGILKDHFYYQLVSNIRKYKGVEPMTIGTKKANVRKTIDIHSAEDQWADVALEFHHYMGNTKDREAKGWGNLWYENKTMRNDILQSKVAYDDNYIYFMVETKEALTDSSDPAWMRLLIDTDPTGMTENWEGFEYIINRVSPNGQKTVIEKSTGGWNFQKTGTASFSINGNRLQLAVPRKALGMQTGEVLHSFGFKWADNTRAGGASEDSGDILDFYQYGDVAPGGRFRFAFHTEYGPASYIPESLKPVPWYAWTGIGAVVAGVVTALTATLLRKKKKRKK